MLPRNLWGVLRGEGDRTRAAARRCSCTMRLRRRTRREFMAPSTRHSDDAWAELGVKSIGDLGSWKFAAAAHAIATLAACEASDASQHK